MDDDRSLGSGAVLLMFLVVAFIWWLVSAAFSVISDTLQEFES